MEMRDRRDNPAQRARAGSGGAAPRDETIRDVMTPEPTALEASSPALDAARIMRDQDIGNIIGLERGRLLGVLTDRDIVVRVVAEGADPQGCRIGEVCSRELTTIAPTASVDEAVRLMREKAIRRLPVVGQEGHVIGIVTIGDLAMSRDPGSALAEISSAHPNT